MEEEADGGDARLLVYILLLLPFPIWFPNRAQMNTYLSLLDAGVAQRNRSASSASLGTMA